MSKSQLKIASPARSQGAGTPRRAARAAAAGGLSEVVEKVVKEDFVLSPWKRRSVLPDDTEIEAPRRASWWKRLDGSSREVLEALDTNKMTDDMLVEEYEFEIEKDKKNQSVPESSDNESVASIVVPQRRLFNQKKQPQGKFADIMGSRKSLGKTNDEDQSIEDAPKNLFNKGPRNKPVFPAALLNSTNKTINKTVEPEPTKQARPNLFGQAGTKRKNMFTDFVLSDSEEDSDVQHKIFGFQMNNNKRISLGTRNRRMPSLTPSMTTEIDIDDWNLLPSSTMIGAQDVSRMSTDNVEQVPEEIHDTLTEENESLNRDTNNQPTRKKSIIENDDNDKTLTNENIEGASKIQDIKMNKSEKINKTLERSKTKLNFNVKDRSSTQANAENVKLIEGIVVDNQQNNSGTKNQITVINEKSLEDKIAELHGKYEEKEESLRNILFNRTKVNLSETKTEKRYSKGEQEKSVIENDDNDKTLTNENIEDASKIQAIKMNKCEKNNKALERSKAKLNVSVKDKSSTQANAENVKIIEEIVVENQQNNAGTKNQITVINEKSLEDKIAELHGEYEEKEESQQNIPLNVTKENLSETNTEKQYSKVEQEIKPSAEGQEVQGVSISKVASNVSQNKDDFPENDDNGKELEHSNEAQKSDNGSKETSNINQDEDMVDVSIKDKSGGNLEPVVEEQQSQEHSKEEGDTNQDMENESEEGIEPSAEEQATHEHSGEGSQTNQVDVDDKSEERIEPSVHDEETQEESNEESQEIEDEEMDVVSEKDKSEEPSANNQASYNDSKEESHENQDEDMEEMVWNDNDDENASNTSEAEIAEAKQNQEVVSNEKGNKINENDGTLGRNEISNKSRNLANKSHKIIELSLDNDQIEEDLVEETPNNSTHDTTGRNRKKETIVKSPEAVLQNMTNDNESFRPIGRSTTFRKSKSVYETMYRPSVASAQESTLGSEGSRNSSTEGSGWDSHRTTRKTIRQTLGKEYTTRKSLRALVMEQSTKRQTELYNKNTSNLNKTKNKTVIEGNDKNASKMKKTKNKTVLEDANKTAIVDRTRNKTILEDVNNKNASAMNKTKNKTVIEDIDDQLIRFRRTSNRNLSSNQSPTPRSPVLGTSAHHVPDPLIAEHQLSYHKSLHDIKDPVISEQMCKREDSINIPLPENNDSGPEISMNASYGQGMSADTHHETSTEKYESSDVQMKEKSSAQSNEVSGRNATVRPKFIHNYDQEILDYEASELEKSEREDYVQESVQDEEKDNSESENEMDVDESEQENEKGSRQEIETSEHETEAESEQEESQQEIESEQEEQQEIESEQEEQQEIESEQEVSQQEIESEQEEQQEIESGHEESQQEIESEQEEQQEIESEQEESQHEIESEQEESQQEIESEQEESQQEIESEQEESQQEIEFEQEEPHQELESEHESENDQDRDISQPESDQESDLELSRGHDRDSEDNDDFVSRHSQYQTENTRGVSRVVFDSQMMSVEEIDFEGVSRHTGNISEQSERDGELSRNTLARVSEASVHEVSMGTRKSMLLMQMQKISQQNMELRQKIREKVQKSLKPPRNCNMSPVPKYSVRRITKEPRQPKKPKPAGIPMEMLPKAFVEDLKYKPPKRFQPPSAPWITKRLYKFLEAKLEPKYDYRARVRAEELVQTIHSFCKLVRRRARAPPPAVAALQRELARLRVVSTHHDFYQFFHQFMPREVRIKVNPDVVNKIPMPRNVFGEILESRTALD